MIALNLGIAVGADYVSNEANSIRVFAYSSSRTTTKRFGHRVDCGLSIIIHRWIPPLFAAFAFVMSAAGILQIVYPPELFPTELRSRGIGVVIACSRIRSASSTFLLPIVVQEHGVYVALSFCMAVHRPNVKGDLS